MLLSRNIGANLPSCSKAEYFRRYRYHDTPGRYVLGPSHNLGAPERVNFAWRIRYKGGLQFCQLSHEVAFTEMTDQIITPEQDTIWINGSCRGPLRPSTQIAQQMLEDGNSGQGRCFSAQNHLA